MVHGRGVTERRYETSLREKTYLREHRPLLRTLRSPVLMADALMQGHVPVDRGATWPVLEAAEQY